MDLGVAFANDQSLDDGRAEGQTFLRMLWPLDAITSRNIRKFCHDGYDIPSHLVV